MPRQPCFYITHGGGPCFWMEFPPPLGPRAFEGLRAFFAGLLAALPARPTAVLVVSAHWEAPVITISTAHSPGMLYDYYGFPRHTYELKYPAPGAPGLGLRAQSLLRHAGIACTTDDQRGFDHAVFVPMLIIDPQASIPVVTISLQADLDPAHHLAVGTALAPLRDEGVLILASGSSYHNLRAIFEPGPGASMQFDAWLNETITATETATRDARLVDWQQAPGARASHPRAEHLIPLMVAAGAAGDETGRSVFREIIGGKAYSCFAFGNLNLPQCV